MLPTHSKYGLNEKTVTAISFAIAKKNQKTKTEHQTKIEHNNAINKYTVIYSVNGINEK